MAVAQVVEVYELEGQWLNRLTPPVHVNVRLKVVSCCIDNYQCVIGGMKFSRT